MEAQFLQFNESSAAQFKALELQVSIRRQEIAIQKDLLEAENRSLLNQINSLATLNETKGGSKKTESRVGELKKELAIKKAVLNVDEQLLKTTEGVANIEKVKVTILEDELKLRQEQLDLIDAAAELLSNFKEELGDVVTSVGDIVDLWNNLDFSASSLAGVLSFSTSIANVGVNIFNAFRSWLTPTEEVERDLESINSLMNMINSQFERSTQFLDKLFGQERIDELERLIQRAFNLSQFDPFGIVSPEDQEKYFQEWVKLSARLSEELTGTTADSLADGIIQGFQNGQVGSEMFAENFEELIFKNIQNA